MENPMKFNIATRAPEKFILESIAPEQTDKILDVGCGLGYFTSKLQNNGTVYGVDLDREALSFARRNYDVSFVIGDALKLPFKDSEFDYILASEVIEHVPNDRLFMEEMKRVIKNNGTVVLATVASEGLLCPTRTCHESGLEYHYKDSYSEDELIRLMDETGFKILKIRYTLSFFTRIIIELTKTVYSVINPSFEKQSDILKDADSFLFKIYKFFFPVMLILIKLDNFLSRFIKGSCIIITMKKLRPDSDWF